MIPYAGPIAAALALAGAAYGGWYLRDLQADSDALEAEREHAKSRAALLERAADAARETERRLADAAKNAAGARADADRVRDLSARVRASAEASERDRERIEQLARLVAESASVVEEGIGVVGRLDARLTGCQSAP